MARTVAITNLPPSPDHERHVRMVKYAIAQVIRLVCIILLVPVPGWWKILPAIGAIFLPYFAVVVANNVRARPVGPVERPGALVRQGGDRQDAA
ncbi:DUF3099 domain-containing protein [Pseudolysinimonas sp.]|uniref:DUF3099 domain-containing protein n=1 Tax=Pseudolysinimonas sp. TaxID=2680009 RepID=UPI003F7FB16D